VSRGAGGVRGAADRVVIVGAGIAGLATARALRERAARAGRPLEILVLERSDRPGGNIRTDVIDGYVCEWGPNGFLDNVPETLELVHALGLDGSIQVSDDSARKRFIFRGGVLHQLPEGPGAFVRSKLLSWRAKCRIAFEPFAAKRPDGDETIHAFASRRIGREPADILIDSMVSGIFAGDSRDLSLRACFPKMWQMETDHGGLFRAMLALRKAKRRGAGLESLPPAQGPKRQAPMGSPTGTLTSFREGTEALVRALLRSLGGVVRTNVRVVRVEALPRPAVGAPDSSRRFGLRLADGSTLDADSVVLSGHASDTARCVDGFDPELAATLRRIRTASIVVVCLGYTASRLARPLDGFGFLVPRGQGPRILGCLWDSSVYPGRAPTGKVLIRAMIGGARDPDAIDLPDAPLLDVVEADLRRTMGLHLEPEFVQIFRHPLGIPQYTPGHLDRLAAIEASLASRPGLYVAGNSYRGVSMNSCIAESGPAADRILSALGPGVG